MTEEEELPEGWLAARLGDVLSEPLRNGHSAKASSDGRGVRAITLTAVTYGDFSERNTKVTCAEPDRVRDLWLQPGDILIERSNTPELVGTARLYRGPRDFAIFPDLVIRARVDGRVLPEFVELALSAPAGRAYFTGSAQGTSGSMPKIDQGTIEQFPLAVPPVPEQKRIFEAVLRACASVSGARDRLSRVLATLRRFRRAVLSSACTGRLTGNGGTDEGGREALGSAITVDTSGDDSLPKGWRLLPCAEVIESDRVITYGVIKLGPTVAGGVPVLRSSDVRFLRIERANVKTVSPSIASAYGRTFLRGSEVVVTVRGSLGGVAAVPASLAGFNVSREVAVVPVNRDHEPEFIALAIASDQSQRWLSEVEKGVAYTGINIEDLKQLPLPIPPKAEQRKIVRRVKALFSLADAIEMRVAAASARADKLTQAILAKAFRGELVPTEAERNRRRKRSSNGG